MTDAGQDKPSSQGPLSGAGALFLGLFLSLALAACSSGDPGASLVGVELTPAAIALLPGGAQQFSATGLMSDGSTGSVSVTWLATGGTVSSGGMYNAGTAEGTYRIVATTDDGAFADTAAITISVPPPNLVGVELSPPSATLQSTGTQQFAAVGRLSNGSTTSIPINWTATGGVISPAGLYTAGSTAGAFRVVASSAGGEFADTSSITIEPHLTSVTVAPATALLAPGGNQQFSVTGHMSDGSTVPVTVNWTATGGTISAGGEYTAGSTDGAWRAIATTTDGELADTAEVTITAPPPGLVAIEISPDSARLGYNPSGADGTTQFTAVGRLSSGGTTPVSVTWSTETFPGNPAANTINSTGFFVAGRPIGRYLVTASQVGGSLTAQVPVIVHSTTGYTASAGPPFWSPTADTVKLCISNHFTDDGTRGGVASVSVSSGGGVISPSIPFTTDPVPRTYSDGTGEVKVYCQPVWGAPAGMTGTVDVTISVATTRPGSGMAKVFTYDQPCLTADCRASYNPSPELRKDFSPNWTTATVSITVPMIAGKGANVWFKPTYVP